MEYLSYLTLFLTLAVTHFLAMASPGPTFIMVVQQSLVYSKKTALWTCLGIGLGELFHVTYSLLGLGWIISQSPFAFTVLKIVGATYLIVIGIKLFKKKEVVKKDETVISSRDISSMSRLKAFRTGFLTNVLNPKATLFFLSLFSVIMRPETPFTLQLIVGLWMCMVAIIWFSLIALFFSSKKARSTSKYLGRWINRITGGLLIALGVRLALTS